METVDRLNEVCLVLHLGGYQGRPVSLETWSLKNAERQKKPGFEMSCQQWGRAASEDEIRVLVGPAAVIGTILAAVARGIRPEGMAIGTRGRRGTIAMAAVLAVATVFGLVLAIYATETCSETVVVGRTGDTEVSLLQMFWMLVPGVGTAAITSAMCNLAATKLSLPMLTRNGWKVNHIKRVVQNGVVTPRDDYGIGVNALRVFSPLWCLAYGTWALVTLAMVYTTARGDLTNGLLNLAGLLAVATNTGIPIWNASKMGSGQDSKSKNMDLVRTVETNVVGNFYENVAAVTMAVESNEEVHGAPLVLGRTQNFVVANAHATIADYRGEEMDAGRFAKFADEPSILGREVIGATLATTKKLSRVLGEAESGGETVELQTLSVYMCTIAADQAWIEVPAQRRRLLALAMAIAWAMKITGGLGGRIARTDESVKAGHKSENCSCCLHRWTVWRPLKDSANEEMQFLFGRSGHLPQIKPDKEEYAASVWKYIQENVGSTVRNRGLLLYYWCMAMMDNAMLQPYDSYDFFPQASVKVQAFTAKDFKFGCSNRSRSDEASNESSETWVPSIDAPNSYPSPRQECTVDRENLETKFTKGRHRMYPHPKVLDHVARRMIYRGAMVQTVIWSIQGLRGLFAG